MFTLQVQQQYVNAEGQLVSVHQVDQHLVYSGVPQQQLLAQSVEVSGTHTQVAQIPGQQVYLQQVKLPSISLPYFSLSLWLDSKVNVSVDTWYLLWDMHVYVRNKDIYDAIGNRLNVCVLAPSVLIYSFCLQDGKHKPYSKIVLCCCFIVDLQKLSILFFPLFTDQYYIHTSFSNYFI